MESSDAVEIGRGDDQSPPDNLTLQGLFRTSEMHSFSESENQEIKFQHLMRRLVIETGYYYLMQKKIQI